MLESVVADQRRLLGVSEYETLMTERELARCDMASGNFAKAADALRQIVARLATSCKPADVVLLSTRLDSINCEIECGRAKEARANIEEVLALAAVSAAPESELVLATRKARAACLFEMGLYDEAERETRALLCIYERHENAPTIAMYRQNLAIIAHARGAPLDATQFRTATPWNKCETADACMQRATIAKTLFDKHDYAGALREYRCAHEALKRVRGISPGNPDILFVRGEIAFCLDELGRASESLDEYRAVIEEARRSLGDSNHHTLKLRRSYAVVLSRSGAKAAAHAEFARVLEEQTRPDAEASEHELATAQLQLASISEHALRVDMYRDILPTLESLRAHHPDTLQAKAWFEENAPRCSAPACSTIATDQCSRCRRATYCSAACQHAHWPAHRETCHAAPAQCNECAGSLAIQLLKCNRCGTEQYCSKKCRHAAWAMHKPHCILLVNSQKQTAG